jgi:hypothetical protein
MKQMAASSCVSYVPPHFPQPHEGTNGLKIHLENFRIGYSI